MCDCATLSPFLYESSIPSRRLGFSGFGSSSTIRRTEISAKINGTSLPYPRDSNPPTTRKAGIRPVKGRSSDDFKPSISGFSVNYFKPRASTSNSAGISGKSGDARAKKYESLDEFVDTRSSTKDGLDPATESVDELETAGAGASAPSSFDFLELKRELEKEESGAGALDEDGFVPGDSSGSANLDSEEVGVLAERPGPRGGRQVMRRSNLFAKQVISIQSACSLGFVSQLWVDTRSWVVVLIEVRPNLLSGEIEKFPLEDVSQVGDVVLVQDESVIENELKMINLDTLVGYNVVTSGRHNVGKVRGYTFNINSGAVESLELDSFGISIIPASLVSTYCLLVEDVLEVVSDTIVVHEGAVSRLQRLTKGIWNTRNVDISGDEMGEYFDFGRRRVQPVRNQSNQKNFSSRKFRPRMRETEDDWELPMDY